MINHRPPVSYETRSSVHREINQIVRDNPGAEFALRDLEATYQAGCVHIVGQYLFG